VLNLQEVEDEVDDEVSSDDEGDYDGEVLNHCWVIFICHNLLMPILTFCFSALLSLQMTILAENRVDPKRRPGRPSISTT